MCVACPMFAAALRMAAPRRFDGGDLMRVACGGSQGRAAPSRMALGWAPRIWFLGGGGDPATGLITLKVHVWPDVRPNRLV